MARTQSKTPIVFIPGIKGSTLIDAQGQLQWVTARQAIGLHTPNLRLPLEWNGTQQLKDEFQSQDLLERISLPAFFSGKEVYGPWIQALHRSGRTFRIFPYDWRRDNSETVLGFEKFLEQVRFETESEKVQVVAHSMGGLISIVLLNSRPDLFHSLLLAGVPIKGGVGFLPDLHKGTAVGLNRQLLSPEVLWTFPSVYSLFPLAGTTNPLVVQNGFFADCTPAPIDFFSIQDWQKYKLGPFRRGRIQPPLFLGFMEQALSAAKIFREKIQPSKQEDSGPPVVHLMGNKVSTLDQIVVPKFYVKSRASGDGRVLVSSGTLRNLAIQIIPSPLEHADLLNDSRVFSILESMLQGHNF